jgi:hypothetical protein
VAKVQESNNAINDADMSRHNLKVSEGPKHMDVSEGSPSCTDMRFHLDLSYQYICVNGHLEYLKKAGV